MKVKLADDPKVIARYVENHTPEELAKGLLDMTELALEASTKLAALDAHTRRVERALFDMVGNNYDAYYTAIAQDSQQLEMLRRAHAKKFGAEPGVKGAN